MICNTIEYRGAKSSPPGALFSALGARVASGRAISPGVGLEQFDEVARRIFEQDLLAGDPLHGLAAKAAAGRAQSCAHAVEVVDGEMNAVPAAGLLPLALVHGAAAPARR